MKTIEAEIITIGDELLFGQIVDTNSQWLAARLSEMGIRLVRRTSVGDSQADILAALTAAENRAHLILTTGGLGPTKDDITKHSFAKFFGYGMRFDEAVFEQVKKLLASRGRTEITELNRSQAYVPENCQVIENRMGTAPGMWFERREKVFISMPGVPVEMKTMFSLAKEKITAHFQPPVIHHQMIRTYGIPESKLAVMIEQWEDSLPSHIKLAYLPKFGEVKLRLTATGEHKADLERETRQLFEQIFPILGDHVIDKEGFDAADTLIRLLKASSKTITTAESCTGGYISHVLTKKAGASAYFKGAVVAYSNELKENILGVSAQTLQIHGAVSEAVVREMAEGSIRLSGADYSIAVSGVAGPEGGTPEKPVGTIWVAVASAKGTQAKLMRGYTDRQLNIEVAQLFACNFLVKSILNEVI